MGARTHTHTMQNNTENQTKIENIKEMNARERRNHNAWQDQVSQTKSTHSHV